MRRAVLAAALVLAACNGGDDADPAPTPVVEQIAPALEAIEAELGAEIELFQVTATLEAVELVMAGEPSEGGRPATGYTFAGGELGPGAPLGVGTGSTFTPEQVTLDPDRIFDDVADELDAPVISKLEILAGEGSLVYSAVVLGESGGTLLVDLGPDGAVLAVDLAT